MTRHGITWLIAGGVLTALALVVFFPQTLRSEPEKKTLEDRVAALEQELASRPSVAIVDIEPIVNDYKKTADFKAKRKEYLDARQSELDGMKDAIAKLKERQDKAPADSEEWWECEGKITAKERLMSLRTKQIEDEINTMQMKDLEEVYKDILAAVRKVAAEKGIDLVYWKHGDIDEETWKIAREEGNLMSHRYMLDIRDILYASDKVRDITEDVKKALAPA
jgi:Skp family chaperone for outer membrane proteins